MNSKTNHNNQVAEEGKKILYRLLLLAVAVVYALVFILDYLLHLHFTFFLLLSLFGFVIMTLLYMWFKVSGTDVIAETASTDVETEEKIFSKSTYLPDMFGDSVFILNAGTGLTIDCTEAAAALFEAVQPGQLIGLDLTMLFDQTWKAEDRESIRQGLDTNGKAVVTGNFKTLKGKIFSGRLEAFRTAETSDHFITVRISELEFVAPPIVAVDDEWMQESYFPVAVIGINYRFAKVNKAFSDLLNYTEEELAHLLWPDIVFPDDRQTERKTLSELFSGNADVSKMERRLIKRNNEVIWVTITSSVIRGEEGHPRFVVLMAENITQRKRIEKTMAENNSRLSSFIENSEYAVVSIDHRQTILMINAKLCDQLFVHTGIVVEKGFCLLDILPEDFHKEYLSLHERAFNGEHINYGRQLNINGNKVDVELIISPVKDESGKVKSITIFGHDITSRKKAEVELIRSRDEAEAATQAKSGFLATMSHEIRTPLNGVIGMGRLLSQTPLSPKQQEFVDSILLSGEALLSVINDILDYSKIESAKMELEYKPFALKRCIEETFDLLSAKAIEKKLSLHYLIARDVPAYIYGDITRLRQILMNLVSNAIKFTPKGSVTISVSTDGRDGKALRLHFNVLDTGVGIPKDKIGKLFKAFSQADASTVKIYGGTGLGLAICKNLVELMGGKIWVESSEGSGSDFQFTIRTEAVLEAEIPQTSGVGTNRLANSYVLIISDEKVEADVYASYFRRWGMIPQVANDTKSALQLVRERTDLNLVLIDSQMISAKATDIARDIRVSRSKEALPVVLFNVDREGEMFFDYTNEIISAVIPQSVDRSKVLDILIGVFSVEDHQRSQHDKQMNKADKKIGEQIPCRILIAEDNHINQKLALNIFEGLGYKPTIVSNGLQVIDSVRAKEFDLIFMDVQMPEMDGLEATRFIIHKMELSKRPVIVAMTAFALEGDKEKCMEAGMDDYISKPFLVEEIVEKIRKWGGTEKTIPMKNASAQAPVDSSILNMNTLSRLKELTSAADPAFLAQVIQMFIDQSEEVILELKTNGVADSKVFASLAHKLKGSALNVGATAMAESCRKMEIKGKEHDMDNVSIDIQKLQEEFAITKAALKEYLV